jgi:glycosyltransferase involved in cell wall biosynthesis
LGKTHRPREIENKEKLKINEMGDNMKYVLITPVKNEEKHLPKLAECIINQTILPHVWIILNDCSSDKTPIIIKELERNHNWIKGVKFQGLTKRDLDEHFGEICNFAFKEAMKYCDNMKLSIDYLAKVDADIIIPINCIEEVLSILEENKEVGVIGPHLKYKPNASFRQERSEVTEASGNNYPRYDLQEPSDGLRIYRVATYKDIGGIPETLAPDVVALAKAKLKGWQVHRYGGVIAYKTRQTSASIQSIRNGYKMQGLRRYYLNYPISMLLLYAALEVLNKTPDLGVAMLSGYFNGILNKKEKINDKEIRDYFRKKRPREIMHQISRKIT